MQIALLIFQIFLLWVKESFEKDQEKKELQKVMREAAKDALKEKDPEIKASRVTAVLDDIRIMHEDG